nr:uncharacterized protein LOC129454573 [Misgurnus anguillicaudatus]
MTHRGKGESYVWTDDEVEMLLNVTHEYKVNKINENVDWESCQSKYADILALFLQQYPSETSQQFPHRKEDITRTIITNKLKAIRVKYRQAVDSGRKSGHGRVVLLYFELCEQIWGGSPATTTIPSGIETTDIDAASHRSSDSASSSTLHLSAAEMCPVSDQLEDSDASNLAPSVVKERRALLNEKLKGHKQDRLKRKLPAETQLLHAAEEDIKMKKRILDMMETSEKQASENFRKLSTSLDSLTSSIADGFSLLRQVIMQPPQPFNMSPYQSMGPYGNVYASAPPPNTVPVRFPANTFPLHTTPATFPPSTLPATFPPSTTVSVSPHTPGSTSPVQGFRSFSFTQELFQDEI